MFWFAGPKLVHFAVLCSILLIIVDGWEECDDVHYTNSWAVHIENGEPQVADRIAKRHGFINLGQVGSLPGYYHFIHKPVKVRRKRREVGKTELLLGEKEVKWVEQQQVLERDKRSIIPDFVGIEHPKAVTIQDPLYKDQWYLNNIGQSSGPPNLDINVLPVWSKGVTGKGVVVAILDDGVDYTHPDLVKNYDSKASYDFNDYDNDPMPRVADPTNCHGTKCAGQVAAESGNGICGVGVAFNCSIGGIRMLDGNTTDTIEGSSLSYRNNYIHIYSCAWGPKDDGKRFGRPGTLASKALQLGTKEGRGGLGSIFVWATGNGGLTDDDCNCDGYTTSIYTISIGAISDHGLSTYYTESCASTLAVTYSGGSHREKRENKIITTTLNHKCTDQFKGTSSAAPLAAGIIALMLEANSKLTWRDVQSIIVDTALMTSPLDEGWRRNGAGKWFNQKFGFGRMDASQLVSKAKTWDNVAEQRKCWGNKNDGPWKIPESGTVLVSSNASACSDTALEIKSLEHVQLVISLKHRHRGHLSIELISPSGTRSQILKTRRNDHSNKGLKDWIFMSVHFWGEDPKGSWTLSVTDNSNNNRHHYRLKVKHGDLEDATEALQDELMGRPRPQEDDVEASSQEHEGVIEKAEKQGDTKLSEDFEGGIFDNESYRSSLKKFKKKGKGKKKEKKKEKKHKHKKEKKGKKHISHHHHHHQKHFHSSKKSKPTPARVKEFTAEPTFFGKTFGDLTNKQGPGSQQSYQPRPTQPRYSSSSNYMPQGLHNASYSQNETAMPQGNSQSTFQQGGQNNMPGSTGPYPQNTGQEKGAPASSVFGTNPDQTLNPTTRHNFEAATTISSSQHEVIQGLVKSVLSEMFTALRAQRNESLADSKLNMQLPGKVIDKEPIENVSSSLTKAWKNEKGVQKLNSLLGILDRYKGSSLGRNLSDADSNGTRADDMVSDVLKVLRDILSTSKTDDKTKEFKLRVAKLVEDSSNETRNLTQKLFDDLEFGGDANRTSAVINDAVSLISAIFQDDSQKKKSTGPPEPKEGVPVGQVGIILRRPDGTLVIPNPGDAGIQMQSSPESMIRTWSNASQIETVRIEHTKVSPVNVQNAGPQSAIKDIDRTLGNGKPTQPGIEKKLVGQAGKTKGEEGGSDIEIEVERSGDGKEKDFNDVDFNNGGKVRPGLAQQEDRNGVGSILNMRTVENGGYVDRNGKPGIKYHSLGPVSSKFSGSDKQGLRTLEIGDLESGNPDQDLNPAVKHKITNNGNGKPDHGHQRTDQANRKSDSEIGSDDDKIDVTVFFDNNDNDKFMNEVKEMKEKDGSEKNENSNKHGVNNIKGLGDYSVQKGNKKSSRKGSFAHKQYVPRMPSVAVIQPDKEDEEADESDEAPDEDSARSKGEIPDSDTDDNEDDDETSTPGMYDMRESLPFYSVPVADQHGFSLLAPVYDPFQDSSYSQGFDLMNAMEQGRLVEDSNDYYEPQNYRHEWKRSTIPDVLPPMRKFLVPNRLHKQPYEHNSNIALLRTRRSDPVKNSPHPFWQTSLLSRFQTKTRRAANVETARQRFANLVRSVHERPATGQSLLGLENSPIARLLGQKDFASTHRNLENVKNRRRRSVLDAEEATSRRTGEGSERLTKRPRRRRSIIEAKEATDTSKETHANNLSNATVHREKRDKIIDDYDDDGTDDDFENEPHVVKRSAIFSELGPSQTPKIVRVVDDDEEQDEHQSQNSRELRTKRESDEDYDDNFEGDRNNSPHKRKISSLEDALRTKLLSMKTQSKSVLKLLKRVHEDISSGNTDDLFQLEAEIAKIEKRENGKRKLESDDETSERKSKKPKNIKKQSNRRHESGQREKLKTKSITPKIRPKSTRSSNNDSNEENEDDVTEAQEKLAYKQNPDEYLRYGTGNTGVLESWTLVFYGT